MRIATSYWRPLLDGLILQLVLLALSVVLLDSGLTAEINLIAWAAFWGGILVLLCRRPESPTRFDLWVLRWGYLPLMLVVQVVARWVWHWRGLL
jgi:hypothetical protein